MYTERLPTINRAFDAIAHDITFNVQGQDARINKEHVINKIIQFIRLQTGQCTIL